MSGDIEDEDIYYSDSDCDYSEQTASICEQLSISANDTQLNDTYDLSEREFVVTDHKHTQNESLVNGKCGADVWRKCCDTQTDGNCEQLWPTIEKRVRCEPIIDAIKHGFHTTMDELLQTQQTLSLNDWYSQLKDNFAIYLREMSAFSAYQPDYGTSVLSELSDVLNELACDRDIDDSNRDKREMSSQTDVSGDILFQCFYMEEKELPLKQL